MYGYDPDEFYEADEIPDAAMTSSDDESIATETPESKAEESGGMIEIVKGSAKGLVLAAAGTAAWKSVSNWFGDDPLDVTDIVDADDLNASVSRALVREGLAKLVTAYTPSGSETAA